jgi:gamma-glutamylcyclotransferase (GGCT)/AIG2-like uncharacterized protein YtfP
MRKANSYLFVYGTLLDQENEFAAYLNQNCSFYAKGRFKGALYDAGAYPAAIFLPESSGYVYGKIFVIRTPNEVLKQLDDYEGYGTDQAYPNLFIRERLKIETAKNLIPCWVYLYNLPVDGLLPITSGNYFIKNLQ